MGIMCSVKWRADDFLLTTSLSNVYLLDSIGLCWMVWILVEMDWMGWKRVFIRIVLYCA
jgi:hypothetical protein